MERKVQQLNNVRRQVHMQLMISIALLFTLWIMIVALFPGFAIVAFVAMLIMDIIIYYILVNRYGKQYKKQLLPLAFDSLGQPVTYREKGFDRDWIKQIGLFGRFTVYSSEDHVSGEIRGYPFECADVRIGYYQMQDENDNYVPICHGQLYVFHYPKAFRTTLFLRESYLPRPSGLKTVKMEHVEFNKIFNIYSDNEHECFYLLTPPFMERLLRLEREANGKLFIAFKDNQLLIAIHNNHNRLEPPLLAPIDSQSIIDEIKKDLSLIQQMIDTIDINPRVFK